MFFHFEFTLKFKKEKVHFKYQITHLINHKKWSAEHVMYKAVIAVNTLQKK